MGIRHPHLYSTRRGQAFLEYTLAICGLALVAMIAAAILSAKTGGQVGIVTSTTSPGAHPGDNGPIDAQPFVEITEGGGGTGVNNNSAPGAVLDFETIAANNDGTKSRLGEQFGLVGETPYSDTIIQVFENGGVLTGTLND